MDTEERGLKEPMAKPAGENKSLNIFKKMMLNPDNEKQKEKDSKQLIAKDRLETYTHKLEYMFLKLGGEDEEM